MLLSGLLPRHHPFHEGHQKGQRKEWWPRWSLASLESQGPAAGAQTRDGYDLRNSFYHHGPFYRPIGRLSRERARLLIDKYKQMLIVSVLIFNICHGVTHIQTGYFIAWVVWR